MADTLPRFTVFTMGSVVYVDESSKEVLWGEESVFSPLAKIEIEPAKVDNKYFHLRFCHTNKYWAAGPGGWIVAESNKPEEDITNPSCTLFEPHNITGRFHMTHVQTGSRLQIQVEVSRRFYVGFNMYAQMSLTPVDWDTIVNLPKRVAFKGDNDKYLKGVVVNGNPFLKFSSDDQNEEVSGYEVQLMADGHVRIKSDHFGKFWRRSPNWIWADSSDSTANNSDTLFWPVKIDDNTIALRNAGNNNFCKRLSTENNYDCLNAAVSTITKEARLGVQELVMERKIYNVIYRMEDDRIFNETPYMAGSTTLINDKDGEASMSASITYTDERTYTFSRSVSISAGISSTIEAGLPFIEKASVTVTYEISASFQWDSGTTTSTSITATGAVPVPGKTTAIVDYVGTKGTCNVPFSYTQEDKSSTDGQIIRIEQIDGSYNGVNCYNFAFHVRATQPL